VQKSRQQERKKHNNQQPQQDNKRSTSTCSNKKSTHSTTNNKKKSIIAGAVILSLGKINMSLSANDPSKIVVVGAGIQGTSVAYHCLGEEFASIHKNNNSRGKSASFCRIREMRRLYGKELGRW
jgi:hypothetical protein